MERYLFLIIALIGAGAVYYDQDLLFTWIGPAIVGAPILAYVIVIFAKKRQVTPGVPEKKEAAKMPPVEKGPEPQEEKETLERPTGPSPEDIKRYADEYRKEAVMWLLSVFQREGRLIDFIQEDISPYDDAQVGAAARHVHQGLKTTLKDVLVLGPVIDTEEGAEIEVDEDYDPKKIRLTGNLKGKPPYKGILAHPGWRVERINLPRMKEGEEAVVVCQAEVEIS